MVGAERASGSGSFRIHSGCRVGKREDGFRPPAESDLWATKAMKAGGAQRPPCGCGRGGAGRGRPWKGLLLCCCGERESVQMEALVVVPVSESSGLD